MDMQQQTWAERDRTWVARYRTAIAGRHVPEDVVQRRQDELLEAVRAAGLPAVEVLGDAGDLAAEDASELASTEEAVRTSDGAGLRPALREVGGTLTVTGTTGTVIAVVRDGWYVDVELAAALVAVSLIVLLLSWVVGRCLFVAGRPVWMAGVLLAGLAVAVAGITTAVRVGPDVVVAGDVPVLLLGVGVLVPAVGALVVAARMPQQTLRQDWDDAEWLRRFRGGLSSRLVSRATARSHAAEVQQQTSLSGVPAHVEFGHPLVLAREVAGADRTARARRWWATTIAGSGGPLLLGLLILWSDTWGALTVPVGLVLLLVGLARPVLAWGERPRARQA